MFDPEEVLRHALTFFQTGQFGEAEELCRHVLQSKSEHASANHLLGLIMLGRGQPELALAALQSAREAAPQEGGHWLALGECLLALGRFDEVDTLVKQAAKSGHASPQMQELRVRAKRGKERKEPPAAIKDEILALFRAQRAAELEARARAALEQYPGWLLGWSALGTALSMVGKDAETAMRRAMQLAPQSAEVHNNLGVHLRERGRAQEALELFRQAIRLRPKYVEAHFNLGAALSELGHYKEAKVSFDRALAIKPDYFDAMVEASTALIGLGREHDAMDVLRRVLKLNPANPKAYTNLLFGLLHRGDLDAGQIFAEHKRFGDQFDRDANPAFGNARDTERCLRIGIVSGDFRHHAVASFLEPLLAQLVRSQRLSLHAYYNYSVVDATTNRLQEFFASWNMVAGMSDDDLVQKIRADGIDILIDLSGHTAHNRLLTFARRAAPVQASWIGYPGTTGLRSMDYYLGDRHFLPPGMFDAYFTEKIVRLPALAPFLPERDAPAVNELPALKNGYLTFGSFNRLSKIGRPVVALWSQLLRELPESRMVLGGMPSDVAPVELLDWFAKEGIARERLSFCGRTTVAAYLGQHGEVDICLDAFPYNGGTTTQHALWMGVPTLSLAGETVPGRHGAMNLGHLGLDEFVVHDADEFVCRGVEWAGRLDELAQLRRGMRERFARSAPGRPELIAAGLEQALRIMWRRWSAGLPPESFEVDGNILPDVVASEDESLLRAAAEHSEAGRLDEADALCRKILETQPGHADANYNLGLMALERGSQEEALPYLLAAWEASPQEGQYWLALGKCLLELCKFDEAIALGDEAIRRGFDAPAIRHMRLLGERGRERAEPSAEVCQTVVNLFQSARHEELESCAEEALREYPGWVLGWNALGMARAAMGKDAETAVRRAVELGPEDAEAHNNLGVFLRDRGRREEALESFRRALRIRPEFVEANFNLGATLQDLGRLEESIASFRRVVEIKPDYVGAWASLGSVLKEQGKMQEAIRVLRRVLDAEPDNADAWNYLLFGLIHCDDIGVDEAFAEHCRYGEHFEGKLRSSWPASFENSRDAERVLRVGFVSGDFFLHALVSFIEPVLPYLAGSPRLELHAYYNHYVVDDATRRMMSYFARWNMIAGLSDDQLVQKIGADGIDILIDLSGHSGRNRLPAFARKPAPIQVGWIGYPGTTGLKAMDYYLGDRYFLPKGVVDAYFTEKIVRLPALAPFMPDSGAPPVNELPALANGHMTFGSFNRVSKISFAVVALWARLLRRLPDSKMVLGGLPDDSSHEELIGWFSREGIDRKRLKLYPKTGMNEYLALHHQVDICLDTFPYNASTTAGHALWMGVPTLTMAGKMMPGRAGAAFLEPLGLDAFIAYTQDEFVEIGVRWARDLGELAQLRAGMRERFKRSAMGRPDVIASAVERALRSMWRRWCVGLPPESFDVQVSFSPFELLQHAAAFFQAGKWAEAEELCLEILREDITHPDANYNIGLGAMYQGQMERALPYLRRAWEIVPTEVQYGMTLAECLLELRRFNDALSVLDEVDGEGETALQRSELQRRARCGQGK